MFRRHFATAIFLTLLLAAGTAHAEGFFGVQAGANFASMGGDMAELGDELALELEDMFGGTWTATKKGRQTPALGVYFAVMQNSGFGIQFEANYVSRGTRFDLATGGVQANAHLKFNYLEVPVLFRYQPAPGEKRQIVFLVGPVAGFKTSPKIEVTNPGVASTEADLEGVKSFVLSLEAAVAFRLALNETNALQFQARFHKGLTNAIDDPEFESTAQDFSLFAGWEIALGD